MDPPVFRRVRVGLLVVVVVGPSNREQLVQELRNANAQCDYLHEQVRLRDRRIAELQHIEEAARLTLISAEGLLKPAFGLGLPDETLTEVLDALVTKSP